MNSKEQVISNESNKQRLLRLWPGVVIVVLQWIIRFGIQVFIPDALVFGVFGGIILGLAIVVWWAFFSRAPRFERWGAILMIIISLAITSRFLDKSIATANMGLMFIIYSIPVMSLAFVVWAVASRNLPEVPRRVTMIATILLASGFWVLLRTNGMTSNLHHDFAWRWAETQEEHFLVQTSKELLTRPSVTKAGEYWPGFRGSDRDAIIHGLNIKTDWNTSPPVEIWRRPVGPGCSSFGVSDGLLYTQEQRGDSEAVTCYDLATGKPVWIHNDKARFWDSHAGAGPRSTPTLYNGHVYTLGATGILNVLDAQDGSVIWSRDIAKDTDVKIPGWGYTSSPLVVDSIIAVSLAGKLLAYDLTTGSQRWAGPDGGESYSSPHLFTIDGVRQIAFMNKTGVTGFAPEDGKILWKIPLMGSPIIQPAQISESDILIGNPGETGGKGMQRFTIKNGSGGWITEERWTSDKLRPYFNDFVVHKGHAYGFDGLGLSCISIDDGKQLWRGGRYGGQIILLADQDVILVLSEKGELALVSATPDNFTELARFPAIKGKTWNHPVLAGDVLIVRNSIEMAAFRLILSGS